MAVHYYNEDTKYRLRNKKKIANWITEVIESENSVLGDINIIFCSDTYLLEINKKYLKHDYYTDIVTFDLVDGNRINGDLFISTQRVKENARQLNIVYHQEIHRVIIHGILHLLGYKDKTETEINEMRKQENFYIDKLVLL